MYASINYSFCISLLNQMISNIYLCFDVVTGMDEWSHRGQISVSHCPSVQNYYVAPHSCSNKTLHYYIVCNRSIESSCMYVFFLLFLPWNIHFKIILMRPCLPIMNVNSLDCRGRQSGKILKTTYSCIKKLLTIHSSSMM